LPRSSGTYSPPAGQPVVTGTTISSTVFNTLVADIGNELTNSIPRDGTAPPTANVPMGNYKLTGLAAGTVAGDSVRYEQVLLLAGGTVTGATTFSETVSLSTAAINEARSTVVATATTTPMWDAANGNVQDWTGTPTITNLPAAPQAGARRTVYPAAGTIFTDNANIDVQGDSNYTVVAGDKVYIEALTTTTFKVFVERKSAQPIFVARNNVSQSVTTSTVTKVTLGTEIYDTNSNFASSRFTPTVAGYYMIDATLRGEATNLTQIISFLYFNGAEYRRGGTINTPAVTGAQTVKISEIIYFNGTTDYVELYGSVTGTTPSFDFISSSICTVFSGHFIRA
jgi:hypothetical protein